MALVRYYNHTKKTKRKKRTPRKKQRVSYKPPNGRRDYTAQKAKPPRNQDQKGQRRKPPQPPANVDAYQIANRLLGVDAYSPTPTTADVNKVLEQRKSQAPANQPISYSVAPAIPGLPDPYQLANRIMGGPSVYSAGVGNQPVTFTPSSYMAPRYQQPPPATPSSYMAPRYDPSIGQRQYQLAQFGEQPPGVQKYGRGVLDWQPWRPDQKPAWLEPQGPLPPQGYKFPGNQPSSSVGGYTPSSYYPSSYGHSNYGGGGGYTPYTSGGFGTRGVGQQFGDVYKGMPRQANMPRWLQQMVSWRIGRG